jgi:hypothetical protein
MPDTGCSRMKLAIMQPYFFPYVGHFDLIFQADFWVVFDTPQFIQKGWVSRNRVLHPVSGWQYVIVPREKHPFSTPINEVRIADDPEWRIRIIGQLQHYKKKAPFFGTVHDLVSECLYGGDEYLSQLNVRTLERVCEYLEIPFQYSVFSEMEVGRKDISSSTERALRLAKQLGADEYINPGGGAHLFDPAEFNAAGVKLTIQTPVDFFYECPGYEFEPNLSIIDVMMWNSVEDVRDYLVSRSTG